MLYGLFVNNEHSTEIAIDLKNNLLNINVPKSMVENKNNLLDSLGRNRTTLIKMDLFDLKNSLISYKQAKRSFDSEMNC